MLAENQIYDVNLINEDSLNHEESKQIYLANNKIILKLLSSPATPKMIYEEVGISMHIILLCLDRLLKKNIVRIKESIIDCGKVEHKYELVSTDISILSKYISTDKDQSLFAIQVISKDINDITNRIISNSYKNKNKTSNIQALFIKISPKKLEQFNEELKSLINKFESMEEKEEKEIYGLVNVLGLYSK